MQQFNFPNVVLNMNMFNFNDKRYTSADINWLFQERIQKTVKDLRWSFLRKWLTAEGR